MLVISIFIIYQYVVPIVGKIGVVKQEVIQSNDLLRAIREKRESITALNSQLDTNKEQVEWVMKYLPQARNEEDVINEVNYIAVSSNVSLYSFSFEEAVIEDAAKNTEEVVPSNLVASGNVQNVANRINEQTAGPKATFEFPIKYSGAKIGIVGDYSSIKTFLQNLRDMDLYNVVHEVTIQLAKYKDDAKKDSTDLLAEINVNFGYMNPMTIQNNYTAAIFEKRSYDFENVKTLKERSGTDVPKIELGTSIGKENPFLP